MNEPFAVRYALARHSTGGVVVDLQSGNYYRVNLTAALVCDALISGGDAAGQVARELDIPRQEAAAVIADVTRGLSGPAVRSTPPGAYHFFPVAEGYVLRHGDRTVLVVDAAGQTIRRSTDSPPLHDPPLLEFYVRALAPKLLFQRGVTVLHASTCLTKSEHLVAFAGLSGAGKTTTARAFSGAGLRFVSEDLMVFVPCGGELRVALGAEAFIHQWAREVTARLLETGGTVPAGDLSRATEGASAPVETILCLDRSRRTGAAFSSRSLAAPDALVGLMTHSFLGAREPENWRRYLASTSALISAIDIQEATAPDGLELLATAVPAYISKRAW
jgi:hypothetical protein